LNNEGTLDPDQLMEHQLNIILENDAFMKTIKPSKYHTISSEFRDSYFEEYFSIPFVENIGKFNSSNES
jgi:hypothetical protein